MVILTNGNLKKTPVFSILSFLNTTKYPPSLLFVLMTMGLPLLFLGLVEGKGSRITNFFVVLGRVPLFFYVVHIYCIHLLGIVGVVLAGRKWTDMILTAKSFSTGSLADYGYGLPVVYLVWTLIVIFMFPLCNWYGEFKRANRSK